MIKKTLPGDTKKSVLLAKSRDKQHHFMMANGQIRGVLLQGTRMIQDMQANHETGVLESIILGQAYLGTALMASNLKDEGQIKLKIECGGPVGGLFVEADNHGAVRGYLANNPLPLEKAPKSLDTSPLFGPGFLAVTRHTLKEGVPFTGQVMLKKGRLAEDLASYYLESEQTPTLFNLSVHLDKAGQVDGAAALFIQVMPGAEDHLIEQVEALCGAMPSLAENFKPESDPLDFLNKYLGDFHPSILSSKRVEFTCTCNKGRFESFLKNLPQEEKAAILEEGPFPLTTTCFNCNSAYHFEKDELEKLF